MTTRELGAVLYDALSRIMTQGLVEGSFRQAMAALDAVDAYQESLASRTGGWAYNAGEWRRDGAETIHICSDGSYWLPSSRREFTSLDDAMIAAVNE